MKITEHFTTEEFGSPPDRYQPALTIVCKALEIIRAHVERPIIVTSGWRSPSHNALVGGAPNSDHIRALAADFRVDGLSSRRLCNAAEDALTTTGHRWDQLIWYERDHHVHLGMGSRLRGEMFRGDL